MIDWVVTIILAFFACFTIWWAPTEFSWQLYAAIVSFVIASSLMLPPLWREQSNRRWRYIRLAAVVFFAAVGFLMPVKTTVIKLDMPSVVSSPHP